MAQTKEVTASINRDIAEVSQASNEMTTSSSQVDVSAEELARMAETINGMVGKFKVQRSALMAVVVVLDPETPCIKGK